MTVRVIYRRSASAGGVLPKPKPSWVTVALLGAVTFTGVGGQHSGAPPVVAAAASPANGLGFRLERTDRDVWLRWNRESDIVIGAVSGTLIIGQGRGTRTVALTHDQLRYGRIFYLNATDQDSFRLRVLEMNGALAEASVSMNSTPPRISVKLE